MPQTWFLLPAAVVLHQVAGFPGLAVAENARVANVPAVVCSPGADLRERLAAGEIRRYFYLRTGELPLLLQGEAPPAGRDAVVVANKDRPIVGSLATDDRLKVLIGALQPQQYLLRTIQREGRRVVLVIGGDGTGTLYGAYRLAERLGVRFFLHGDVIPDRRIDPALPELDERGKPLFELRGVNPWGSHPFGFDLWNTDDYQAHIGQLAKMRMNFIGMHCYGEGHPYAEPTVWVGLPGDFDSRGRVGLSYPSSYYTAAFVPGWGGLRPGKTGDYHLGAAMLFDRDDWGPDAMLSQTPRPVTPEGCNQVFNRTAAMFREAFGFARLVGVKTCIGTEAPLTVPQAVRQKLKRLGKDPTDPAVVGQIYEGIFRRIAAAHPLDYYWLWTPEDWTWRGNVPEQLMATVVDVKIARAALKRAGDPFRLATCGWVLGPKDDRAGFDRHLPGDVALSAISRHLGEDPVDPAYGRVERRDKWAIPWMEGDNGGLAVPQLWVGRTRQDAVDAHRYGCTGLMGLIWRTRILGPNVAALAQAGWEQPWKDQAAANDQRMRKAPCEDFYEDWAAALFGPAAAGDVAKIFAKIDSRLPRPLCRGCPAGVRPDRRPWELVAPSYAFVDDLANCHSRVAGPGNLARFDYWLGTVQYLRAGAKLDCAVGKYQSVMAKVNAQKDPQARKRLAAETALPVYREIRAAYTEAFGHLLDTASTNGGLATVMYWEHSFYGASLEKTAQALSQALGGPLPADAQLPREYQGRPRLIVPTVRSSLMPDEVLKLKVIVLSAAPPRGPAVWWREMGRGEFRRLPLRHVARGVYTVSFPPGGATSDLEYHVEARIPSGQVLRFPATAPAISQTLVLIPAE